MGIGIVTSLILPFKLINRGKKLEFYRKRQELLERGWRFILFTFILSVAGFLIFRFGEPIVYRYFPSSSIITLSPTIKVTPTMMLTPHKIFTPTITQTPTQTNTPSIPDVVQTAIKTPVGVDTKAEFSVIQFSTQIKNSKVINPSDIFTLPISQMYGSYTYDKMVTGVQWTAVWLFEGKVICYKTTRWTLSSSGAGFTDACNKQLSPNQWKPGNYEVQVFVGQTWKSSGKFTIVNSQQSTTASPSPSITPNVPVITITPEPITTLFLVLSINNQ